MVVGSIPIGGTDLHLHRLGGREGILSPRKWKHHEACDDVIGVKSSPCGTRTRLAGVDRAKTLIYSRICNASSKHFKVIERNKSSAGVFYVFV